MRNGELKPVFDILENAFERLGIDYYLIGALARQVWYEKADKTFRTTKDIDFAALIGSQQEYEAVKEYLKEHNGFQDHKGNSFVLITPEGVEVDILPFGAIEHDSNIQLAGTGLTSIELDGFKEVYKAGTEEVELSTGNIFKVATLPAITLLKFIAFDDRPEVRQKDARDIANLIQHFFDLSSNMIYEHHSDLFKDDKRSLESMGAIVIGREMKKIAGDNKGLVLRLTGILDKHIATNEKSMFIKHMVLETNTNVAEMSGYLIEVLNGFRQNS